MVAAKTILLMVSVVRKAAARCYTIDVSTQLCGTLSNVSGNQSRLHLSFCFFYCSPHILPWISLLGPCNLYLQDDILFSLLVVSSALANVWRFFWLLFLLRFCTWSLVSDFLAVSFILVSSKLFLWSASQVPSAVSLLLR